jgi:hypothetical protein
MRPFEMVSWTLELHRMRWSEPFVKTELVMSFRRSGNRTYH